MGVMWSVWSLDVDMTAWLDEQGIAFPTSPSRLPTGSEIKRALSDLPSKIEVKESGLMAPWYAFVEGPEGEWAHLVIQEYSGDEVPQELYFSKGHEHLIRRILTQIVPMCGPLVLLNDAGSQPEVITTSL